MTPTKHSEPKTHSLRIACLGYPRIGPRRELKKATEAYWNGDLSGSGLEAEATHIRSANRALQRSAGIDIIPSNDFSFYDAVLDHTALFGATPERYRASAASELDRYFAMARGSTGLTAGGSTGLTTSGVQEKQEMGTAAVPAMEMTKWFDTNYHYIVPEFTRLMRFGLASEKPFAEFREALKEGVRTRPVLIGPVTYLWLGKSKDAGLRLYEDLLDGLIRVYIDALARFEKLGAREVQIDEPLLVMDLDTSARAGFRTAYAAFAKAVPGLDLVLTTYFGALGENAPLAAELPVAGLHIDLVRAPDQLASVDRLWPKDRVLSLGIIDGRNIWKTDLGNLVDRLAPVVQRRGTSNVILAPSCSLMHVPLDLDLETRLDPAVKNWLSFAKQKLFELGLVRRALADPSSAAALLAENRAAIEDRRRSPRIHVPTVKQRADRVTVEETRRKSPFSVRRPLQRAKSHLPLFPTTTIGSFPQTPDVRAARAGFRNGEMDRPAYDAFIKDKIRDAIRRQTEIGLDVLVHGEFERNDMVEYFGEMLAGFAFTQNGWVQSYGTRTVKPPLIFGDVHRPRPMTVEWIRFAQGLTDRPLKGMLTGPITILQWSFVRDDQPRSETARQIALAIRDEVKDLERAGIPIIQIDEPAIREGLPLRRGERDRYLGWAVEAFRIAASGVRDETQIHTHMCYGEFNDIIQAIADLDADVISIETSRSQMELLGAFAKFKYPNEIGPGVYDIHSPRVPAEEEIKRLLQKALEVLPPEHLWVNPDCGLKTRGWNETMLALKAMVGAARQLRACVFSNKKP